MRGCNHTCSVRLSNERYINKGLCSSEVKKNIAATFNNIKILAITFGYCSVSCWFSAKTGHFPFGSCSSLHPFSVEALYTITQCVPTYHIKNIFSSKISIHPCGGLLHLGHGVILPLVRSKRTSMLCFLFCQLRISLFWSFHFLFPYGFLL